MPPSRRHAARSTASGARCRVWRRAALLHRLAELIDRDADVLAALEATDIGRPIGQPTMLDLPMTAGTYRHFAGWADKINGESVPTAGYFGRPDALLHGARTRRRHRRDHPVEHPADDHRLETRPALAAGNTVVIKPPEDAPLSLLHLGRLIAEAGFPAGVVNIVPGLGEIAGDALSRHPGVDKVSFTGSPEVGRLVQRNAADTFKRVTLELGRQVPADHPARRRPRRRDRGHRDGPVLQPGPGLRRRHPHPGAPLGLR